MRGYRRSVCVSFLLLIALCLTSGMPFIASAQRDDEAQLRELIAKFCSAYERRDIDELMALWSETSPDFGPSKERFQRIFALKQGSALENFVIQKITRDQETAVVRVALDIVDADKKSGSGRRRVYWTFHCARPAVNWRILKHAPSEEELAAALLQANTDQEADSLLAAEGELATSELLRILNEMGASQVAAGQNARAARAFRISLTLAERLGDRKLIGLAFNKVGDSYRRQNNYAQAMSSYQNSLKIAEELADKSAIVSALNSIGNIYRLQGNYATAFDNYQQSLRIAEEIGDKGSISALLNSIGLIYYLQSNYAKALESHQKSLKIAEEIGDKAGASRTLINIGIAYYSQGDYPAALEFYQKGLTLTEALGDKAGSGTALNTIALIHRAQGNYSEAIKYYQMGLKVAEEIDDKAGVSAALNGMGLIYRSQGNYVQALEHYQRSLKIVEEIGLKAGVAALANNIGVIHNSLANYEQALEYYQKSLATTRAIGDRTGAGTVLIHIGNIQRLQGHYAQALETAQESLKIAEETGSKRSIAAALNSFGSIQDAQGNHPQAIEFYQRGLKILEELGDKAGIADSLNEIGALRNADGNAAEATQLTARAASLASELGSRETYWRARTIAGKAYRLLNRPDEAQRAFDDAINTIEDWREGILGSAQHQERFFENKVAPYYQMVDLLLSQNKQSEAFAFAERTRARVLLEVLQTGRVPNTKSLTHEELDQERKLQAAGVAINSQIYKERLRSQADSSLLASLNTKLEKSRLELEAFHTNLYAAHPEVKINRGQMQPISINNSGALIQDANSALLEFVVMEEKSYLLLLTRNQKAATGDPELNVFQLDINQKELANLCQQLRERLASRSSAYQDPASRLYDVLLKPARSLLQNKSSLIIVPDGPLWEIPFQALQPAPKRFLIDDYAISYAPSLTALREMYCAKPKEPVTRQRATLLLAFGNPIVGQKTVKQVKPLLMDGEFLPLPDAEEQVNSLGRIYGAGNSRVYVGADATEDRFKSDAPNCRILHLATHSILNEASPMYSQVVLAQPKPGDAEDGLLEAWEIMNLDLRADLAVLSACETARGRIGAGEGVIGLSWALFVAGCPSTVVSQWKVEAASTSELMVEFHRRLKLKFDNPRLATTKAEALRQAQLKVRGSAAHQHPFYWAGFIIAGDAR